MNNEIKGVVTAAGRGTRLLPMSKVVNKNLLLVYDKPLIYYPILALKDAGVTNILVICSPNDAGQVFTLLGSGKELGVHLTYDFQEEPKGLAHCLAVAEDFADNGKVVFMLGDNVFDDRKSLKRAVDQFRKQEKGAKIVLTQVDDPERFGVPRFSKDKKTITAIIEKPKKSWTNWIIPGFYLLDERVFDFIRQLKPSVRGEYEITDVLNYYAKEGTLTYQKNRGKWIDAGTFDALLDASIFIARKYKKKGKC